MLVNILEFYFLVMEDPEKIISMQNVNMLPGIITKTFLTQLTVYSKLWHNRQTNVPLYPSFDELLIRKMFAMCLDNDTYPICCT